MKDTEQLIADVEQKWSTATNEERNDMITSLRGAEGQLADDDAETRTRIGILIDRVQRGEREEPEEYLVPPSSQGTGFGYGATFPTRFDNPEDQGR